MALAFSIKKFLIIFLILKNGRGYSRKSTWFFMWKYCFLSFPISLYFRHFCTKDFKLNYFLKTQHMEVHQNTGVRNFSATSIWKRFAMWWHTGNWNFSLTCDHQFQLILTEHIMIDWWSRVKLKFYFPEDAHTYQISFEYFLH